MSEIDASGTALPFPYQNALTRPLRQTAARQGRADMLNMWAGQGVRLARRTPARDLVEELIRGMDATIGRISGRD